MRIVLSFLFGIFSLASALYGFWTCQIDPADDSVLQVRKNYKFGVHYNGL